VQVKDPTKGTIYIADGYSAWKVATLRFMQTLWNPKTRALPEKKAMAATIADWVAQDSSLNKKLVLQFAAFMADEAASMGFTALETEMPFDQMEVRPSRRDTRGPGAGVSTPIRSL
jgi:hypothetical protein